MFTLCIRYVADPNRIAAFRTYVGNEVPVIRKLGGQSADYYFPTDFAGPTNIGYGLIDFGSLDEYECYRQTLSDDPAHKHNAAELAASGAVLSMERSFLQRHRG